jgi:hypothetical protein
VDTRPIRTEKYVRVLSVSVTDVALDMKGQTSLEKETTSSVKVNVNQEFLFDNLKLEKISGS